MLARNDLREEERRRALTSRLHQHELLPEQGGVLPGAADTGTAFPIGRALLSTHLFAFEFITLLLVAAIVGAVYLGRRENP